MSDLSSCGWGQEGGLRGAEKGQGKLLRTGQGNTITKARGSERVGGGRAKVNAT